MNINNIKNFKNFAGNMMVKQENEVDNYITSEPNLSLESTTEHDPHESNYLDEEIITYPIIVDNTIKMRNNSRVNICIFNINKKHIYHTYLLYKNNNRWEFPYIVYRKGCNISNQVETVLNQVFDGMHVLNKYKGCIEYNNEYYLLYETVHTLSIYDASKQTNYIYATMHEILNLNHSANVPICENIILFFNSNKSLLYLYKNNVLYDKTTAIVKHIKKDTYNEMIMEEDHGDEINVKIVKREIINNNKRILLSIHQII